MTAVGLIRLLMGNRPMVKDLLGLLPNLLPTYWRQDRLQAYSMTINALAQYPTTFPVELWVMESQPGKTLN